MKKNLVVVCFFYFHRICDGEIGSEKRARFCKRALNLFLLVHNFSVNHAFVLLLFGLGLFPLRATG